MSAPATATAPAAAATPLAGKVALVTGGSRGLGRGICRELAARGAAVAVNYRSGREQAEEVAGLVRAAGGRAVAVGADVSDPEQVAAMVDTVLAELGGLHVLVNNAGIARDALLYDMGRDDFDAVMAVNVGGVFTCTRAVLDTFMAQREGAIVNVSSVMGERGWVGQANYAASKGAINALTRCAAVELARFGIRVNAVLPGFAPTELVGDLVATKGRAIRRQLPMRSFASPEDVAAVVAFLADPATGYLTGTCLPVDGGAAAQLGLGRPE